VKDNQFRANVTRPYHCAYVSRKYTNQPYRYSNEQIREQIGAGLIQCQSIPGIFAQIMGDEGYLIRSATKKELFEWIQLIHQRTEEVTHNAF